MALTPEERMSQRGRARIQSEPTIPEDGDFDAAFASAAAAPIPQHQVMNVASSSSRGRKRGVGYDGLDIGGVGASHLPATLSSGAGKEAGGRGQHSHGAGSPAGEFDINVAYARALHNNQAQHPIAAILALTDLIEVSTATTLTGLLRELVDARSNLVSTQSSLGVRAGCQLFERFVRDSGAGEDFDAHKRHLVFQGREFCHREAPECQRKIADATIQFLTDDCVILTHSYSRVVMQALLKAHKQNKRIKVYVTEARPHGWGMKTHNLLTQAGIPCTVVLDSAVAYILERVDIVLVGTEAVVESGGLVSSIGTSQLAYLAKAMGKPFYALAESYKFLRYYPLSQSDIPLPRWRGSTIPLEFDELDDDQDDYDHDSGVGIPRFSRTNTTAPATPRRISLAESNQVVGGAPGMSEDRYEMTADMEKKNPASDITGPEFIDLVITDLAGAIPPTSVSQYLVAVFAT